MTPHSSTLAWKIPWTGGAWKVAVRGVAEVWTRLSDSKIIYIKHFLEGQHTINDRFSSFF